MALIVEDGTRPTGSNCYISVADADAYHLARGGTAWAAANTGAKEAAILEATTWLNGQSWKGRKVASRTMAWPRADVVDGDGDGSTDEAGEILLVLEVRQVASAAEDVAVGEAGGLSELDGESLGHSCAELRPLGVLAPDLVAEFL